MIRDWVEGWSILCKNFVNLDILFPLHVLLCILNWNRMIYLMKMIENDPMYYWILNCNEMVMLYLQSNYFMTFYFLFSMMIQTWWHCLTYKLNFICIFLRSSSQKFICLKLATLCHKLNMLVQYSHCISKNHNLS